MVDRVGGAELMKSYEGDKVTCEGTKLGVVRRRVAKGIFQTIFEKNRNFLKVLICGVGQGVSTVVMYRFTGIFTALALVRFSDAYRCSYLPSTICGAACRVLRNLYAQQEHPQDPIIYSLS